MFAPIVGVTVLGKTAHIGIVIDSSVEGVKNPFMINIHAQTRFHSNLLRYPCLRLWYLARSQDGIGRGIVSLDWDEVLKTLGISRATLYRYLKDGKNLAAFRSWSKKGAKLTLWLGSLFRVCSTLKLENWGAVDDLAIWEVLDQYREFATLLTVNQIQEKSFYAKKQEIAEERTILLSNSAKSKWVRKIKRSLEKYAPIHLFSQGKLSSSSAKGQEVPCVLEKRGRQLFVSEGFPVYGASQNTIAAELKISDRTIRRHLQKMGVESVQICQRDDKALWRAFEIEKSPSRGFAGWGKFWLRHCSIYMLRFGNIPMRHQRKSYKGKLSLAARNEREESLILSAAASGPETGNRSQQH